MKIVARKKAQELPGISGTVRVDRDTSHLLNRLRAGDIVVIDHQDLDRGTAQAFVDARVAAVVNAQPMISGRYATLGPQVLADAGIVVVESGGETLMGLKDGASGRLHQGTLYLGEETVGEGVELDGPAIAERMDSARAGMLAQLSTFTHHTTEFLQQEESLLLHDVGLPDLATAIAGRPVVVVGPGPLAAAEFTHIKRFVAEQKPVLIGVDTGADVIRAAGRTPHVVVLGLAHEKPATAVLSRAQDVVVAVPAGTHEGALEQYERLNLRPRRVDTRSTPEDLAMLMALAGDASVIVAAGLDATLEEFLDSDRGGLASTFLTRLKVGPRLVDAQVVPALYSGRVRAVHLFWLMLAGLIALAAAFTVTPLGDQWAHQAWDWLVDAVNTLQGKLS